MTGLALLLSLSLRSMSVVLPDGDTSTLLLLLEAYYGPNYQVILFGFLTEKMFFLYPSINAIGTKTQGISAVYKAKCNPLASFHFSKMFVSTVR